MRPENRPPPFPLDEEERLEALRRYRVLDSDPEPQFDRIAAIARRQFGAPIALVAFMDSDRNVFKAHGDLPMSEGPRDISFCGHTILTNDVLVVPDTTKDERFVANPLVTGDPHIRFYAGAPLVTPDGHRIGTVCVLDDKPHPEFDANDQARLKDLAGIVSDHLEMRLIVGSVHDEIETRRAAEAEARRLARHDALTGLPNRTYLQEVIADGPPFEMKGGLAALCADLHQFKSINDALGNRAGDEYLQRTADMIKSAAGERSFAARVSGDEFLVLVDVKDRAAAEAVAERLVETAKEPLLVSGHQISTGLSLGVALADRADPNIAVLLRNADLALHEAKRGGGRRWVTFVPEMAQNADRMRNLERELSKALSKGAIEVHYQPIHSTVDNRMAGVEALARWSHPELGSVSPVEFVAVAEETGQILELGEHILRTAVQDALGWSDLIVSVNLSPVQFRLPDLADQVAAILQEIGFPAPRLQLEITEGVLLHDVDAARRQMETLRGLGIKMALDDFGVGYSSLSYLRSLPFDKVKIDRSFVFGLNEDTTNHAIVQCIVGLARQLNMGVTAEGVETEAEAALLRAAGCTSLQGYYFGKPMPAKEISQTLALKRHAA